MQKPTEDISELLKINLQSLDETAELILLFPQGKYLHEEIQVYVLTSDKLGFEKEQRYRQACYQVEQAAMQNLSLYIYTKDNWHRQLVNTPIYARVCNEGIAL
jgi:hypothetical protein